MRFIFLTLSLSTSVAPVKRRLRVAFLPESRWPFQPLRLMTLPVPVTFSLLEALRLVFNFIFAISSPLPDNFSSVCIPMSTAKILIRRMVPHFFSSGGFFAAVSFALAPSNSIMFLPSMRGDCSIVASFCSSVTIRSSTALPISR